MTETADNFDFDTLAKKAAYSIMVGFMDDSVEHYRDFDITEDPRAFNSREEVDEYLRLSYDKLFEDF